MYYKAILYDDSFIEVKTISEEEAYGETSGIYSFVNNKKLGTFAVRKTKESAIKALEKSLQEQINTYKSKLEKLEEKLILIKSNDTIYS